MPSRVSVKNVEASMGKEELLAVLEAPLARVFAAQTVAPKPKPQLKARGGGGTGAM